MERTIRSTRASLVAVGLIMALALTLSPAHAQTTLFSSDLTIGSTGAQVTSLQTLLISKGYSIPAGATGYFGAQTQAALAAFQAANGIAPAVGYFGPITRAKVNTLGSNTGTPGNQTPSKLGGGEASLEDFDAKEGNDDEVAEGDTGEVAIFKFDVEDGDIELNRLDLSFTASVTGGQEKYPWKTFETITLYVNGDEVASEDVSDKRDWLRSKSPFSFRFSGLDAIVKEGDSAEITVEIEVQNRVKDVGATWTVFIADDGIRGTDGEGLTQTVGDDSETASFSIEEIGAGEKLTLRTSSNDPDASIIKVEDDTRSDWYTVLAFDIEAKENDIDLNDFAIDFTTGTADVEDVIDDVMLVIDGDEFDDFDWNGSGTFASTTFDIDGDFTVDEDDRVEVEVLVRFKAANGSNYATGETIQASVVGANVEGEGADDLTADGNVTGDTHTLETSGISVTRTSRSAQTTPVDGADNDYAVFDIEVKITAFEEDIFIPMTAVDAFTYQFEDAANGAVLGSATATTSSITSNARSQGNYYRINEGDTKTFTFSATLNPEAADEGKSYRMQLLTVRFNDTAAAPDQTWNALPANTYETASTYIND